MIDQFWFNSSSDTTNRGYLGDMNIIVGLQEIQILLNPGIDKTKVLTSDLIFLLTGKVREK